MGNKKYIYFVMGVSGSGKSTIGKLFAEKLSIPFFDGDDYHPEANIKKMAAGNPLTDEDRLGWLVRLNELAMEHQKRGAVIVCSALKESYRKLLGKDLDTKVIWIYLKGSFDEILGRLKRRTDHFMPVELLRSQFETLEPPRNAITVSIKDSPQRIIENILEQLSAK